MRQKNFGKNLKRHRTRLKWSQYDLARAAGLSRSSIRHIESGIRQPSMLSLVRLLRATGASLEDLLK